MLIDKKILSGGIAMLVVGGILLLYFNSAVPAGQAGMTEEEVLELMVKEQENRDWTTLAGIVFGMGFLLILISFGARRRNKGSAVKEEKKPAS